MKICNKCKEPKDESSFNKSARFGLYPTCKECISKRRKELKNEKVLRIKTELHKIVLVENKILKQEGLSQCHTPTCRVEIPISKTNHYCLDCQKAQRDRNKEKVLASKKAYRDKNKEKQKAYRDSRKELQREYDARRYQLQKEEIGRKAKERYKKRKDKKLNE